MKIGLEGDQGHWLVGQSRQEQDREKGMDRKGIQEGEGPAHRD